MANIRARRALSDLFKKGTEIRFGPDPKGGDEPLCEKGPFIRDNGERIPPHEDQVVMWITPADPLQRELALREANAKRAASIVRAKTDQKSEEFLTAKAYVVDLSDETLIDYVVIQDEPMRTQEAEREILAREEWKDITALQDAMRQFEAMPDAELENNPEWESMVDLDAKYGEQISERQAELAETQRETLMMTARHDRASVEKMVMDKRAELAGSSVFMNEYDRWMVFYSVRDYDDSSELFFEHPDEYSRQPQAVKNLISEALITYISDAGEAKNSPGAADGSESSVQPSEPATSDPSTPVGQTA